MTMMTKRMIGNSQTGKPPPRSRAGASAALTWARASLTGRVSCWIRLSVPATMPPCMSPALNFGRMALLMMTLERASVRKGSRP